MQTKICSRCRSEKSVSEFGQNKTQVDGFHSACKPCTRIMQNAGRQKLRERAMADIVLPASQRCDKCQKEKPASGFYRQNDRISGLNRLCKACSRDKTTHYRRKYLTEDAVRFKIQIMISQARTRAKQESVPFNLTFEYLMENFRHITHCPILDDIELDWAIRGHPEPNSPSLDKKIPTLGYVEGNVWIISHQANIMKNNATPERLRKFAQWAMSSWADSVLTHVQQV